MAISRLPLSEDKNSVSCPARLLIPLAIPTSTTSGNWCFSRISLAWSQLPFASIDEQHTGYFTFPFAQSGKAPIKYLLHRCIIISGSNTGNVETSVVALYRTILIKHNTRAYGALTSGVTNVETFNALGCEVEVIGLFAGW